MEDTGNLHKTEGGVSHKQHIGWLAHHTASLRRAYRSFCPKSLKPTTVQSVLSSVLENLCLGRQCELKDTSAVYNFAKHFLNMSGLVGRSADLRNKNPGEGSGFECCHAGEECLSDLIRVRGVTSSAPCTLPPLGVRNGLHRHPLSLSWLSVDPGTNTPDSSRSLSAVERVIYRSGSSS